MTTDASGAVAAAELGDAQVAELLLPDVEVASLIAICRQTSATGRPHSRVSNFSAGWPNAFSSATTAKEVFAARAAAARK